MSKYIIKKQEGEIASSHPRINYQNELNEEQFKVVNEGEGPCLVLAGAGSGKTRTLVYRVAYLIERGVRPSDIMLVTFTNKAAREMLGRVEQLLKRRPQGLWGGTFHSLANRILRRYAPKLGYERTFNILDADDAKSFLKTVIKEAGLNSKDKYFPKANLIHSLISFAENSQLDLAEVAASKYPKIDRSLIPVLEEIHYTYRQRKLSSNVMDFDDLLVNWHRLLEECPKAREKLSRQFRYILVDEYQDTNKIQGMIMERLSAAHKNILVVGDDAQSIYSFRAAEVDNILQFPQNFSGATIFKLEKNYRSASPILDLANASIKNNANQFAKKLRTVKEGGSKPTVVPCRDNYQQAEFIAQRVLELTGDGMPLQDMAVLFRSTYQVLELELELNKRNIPYVVRGGIRFFEQAHIKDILAYLKIYANSKDEISWTRLLRLAPGIGAVTAGKIWQKVSSYDSLKNILEDRALVNFSGNDKIAGSLREINRIFFKLSEIKNDFLVGALDFLLKEYEPYLKSNFDNWQDRREDIVQLANFSASYKKLDDFLADVSLSEGFRGERAAAGKEREKDMLLLSTIHQAKGLEWKVVFVIHLAEGQFPHYKVYDNPCEMEEERRLFYVAVTRAKDELYLTFPIMSESYMTGESINRPSTFLKELPEELFDKWQLEEEERVIDYGESF